MKTIKAYLKPGKEKPFHGRHPWVFSGAIDSIEDNYETGDLVRVQSEKNQYLGTGYLNARSQIAIRMLTFEDEPIDQKFFEKRIERALQIRRDHLPEKTNACRLVNAEGDFLPGLIVDRYADYLVVQFQTAGIEVWKEALLDLLEKKCKPAGIYEKGDIEVRELEGLPKRAGKLRGEEPPDYVEILENGISFVVDIHEGQKTGFFLDQRDNRKLVSQYMPKKARVLNLFSYTGGFSVYAAKAGAAAVVTLDSSEKVLNTAQVNFEKNGLSGDQYLFEKADAFDYLRQKTGEFDLIVVDPPGFAKSAGHVMQATRAYKDVNLWALKRLAPGGILYTSSCSTFVDPLLFQKVIFAAAKDARRGLQILQKTSHPFDHPISIFHPEGEYLKGLLCVAE